MGESLAWWLVLEILGLIALPLTAVIFSGLPDRGYTVAKVLGLLLTTWLAYSLAMMQLASFTRGLLYFGVAAVAGFSAWLLWRKKRALLTKLRDYYSDGRHLRYVLAAELLFTLTFAFWALMRAYSPDIFGTEKFMDFGFMNAIVKSETFPPNDMWLAGYPINYYYFGYVLMASLSLLSGVPTEIGYNLANATIPALLALGTFGLIYNLIRLSPVPDRAVDMYGEHKIGHEVPRKRLRPSVSASQPALPVRRAVKITPSGARSDSTLAVADRPRTQTSSAVTSLANAHAEDEVLLPEPVAPSAFYETVEPDGLDKRRRSLIAPLLFGLLAALMVVAMGHLTTMFAVKQGNPMEGNGWRYCFACQTPQTFDWWGPSRVIKDYRYVEVAGQAPTKQASGVDAINEFPAFSFMLADLHPHVMALPLWTLALSLALAFTLRRVRREGSWRDGIPMGGRRALLHGISAIAIGALYTTNTWDYPTFLLISLAGIVLPHLAFRRANPPADRWRWLRPVVVEAALLVALSFAAFAFFHLTFTSLVGGQPAQIPENLANIPVLGWLLEKAGSLLLINTWDKGITGFLVIFGIFLFGILGWLIYEAFAARRSTEGAQSRNRVLVIAGVVTAVGLLLALLFRFPLFALGVPVITVSLLLVWRDPDQVVRNLVLSIVALATLIAVAIEVVYLRDVFNDRQNTIFKFYYQIWVLYALAAAYGVWRVLAAFWQRDRGTTDTFRSSGQAGQVLSAGWVSVFTLLVASGLMYTVYTALGRMGQQGGIRGLDGTAHLRISAPGDYPGLQWLKANATGRDRVLECCHDEYNVPGHAGRVSAYTGIPTLISWGGHEAQWRGGQPELLGEASVRRQVTNDIYTARGGTMSAEEMLALLHQYEVSYVYVGATERGEGNAAGAYPEERVTPQAEDIFKQILTPVFTSGSTVIYKVPDASPGGSVPNGN